MPRPAQPAKLDRKIPLQVSVPESIVKRLDWLVETMQEKQPHIKRSHIVSQFLAAKLDQNKVPKIS